MRISRLLKLSLIVLLMYMLMIPASTNVVQSAQDYQWKNIPIGGGGTLQVWSFIRLSLIWFTLELMWGSLPTGCNFRRLGSTA